MDHVSVYSDVSRCAWKRSSVTSCRRLVLFLILFQSFSFISLWLFLNPGIYRNGILRRQSASEIYGNNQSQEQHKDPCLPRVPQNVNCRLMMMGDNGYLTSQNTTLEQNETAHCSLSQLLTNCSRFRHIHGYDNFRTSRDELDFPLAFTLKIHKFAEQVEQILRTIYRPHNVYCIYVDLKAKTEVFQTMKDISQCLSNVHVIEDREKIIYASYSHVRAELACMSKCMESAVQWKYYLNMAGEEFPLRTNEEIVHILRKMGGSNDIESYSAKGVENRYNVKHVPHNGGLKKTSEKKPPFPYRLDMRRGSAYGTFSREFVRFILEDDIAQRLVKWFNETISPEELVWSTLNALPFAPGGYKVETRHNANTFLSRAMVWAWDKVKCQGQFIRSVCNFGPRDFPWIVSSPKLILNKVNWGKNRLLADCLEENYKNRTESPQLHTMNWYYYLNLPHVKYYSQLNTNDTSPTTLLERKSEWLKNNIIHYEENNQNEQHLASENELQNKSIFSSI